MAWPLAARGQQAPPPVIGILDSGSPDADGDRMRAYRKGLSETGTSPPSPKESRFTSEGKRLESQMLAPLV